jgi:hypothetical protein
MLSCANSRKAVSFLIDTQKDDSMLDDYDPSYDYENVVPLSCNIPIHSLDSKDLFTELQVSCDLIAEAKEAKETCGNKIPFSADLGSARYYPTLFPEDSHSSFYFDGSSEEKKTKRRKSFVIDSSPFFMKLKSSNSFSYHATHPSHSSRPFPPHGFPRCLSSKKFSDLETLKLHKSFLYHGTTNNMKRKKSQNGIADISAGSIDSFWFSEIEVGTGTAIESVMTTMTSLDESILTIVDKHETIKDVAASKDETIANISEVAGAEAEAVSSELYDETFYQDEQTMKRWEMRRLGLAYLGKEELFSHSEKMKMTERERMSLLMGESKVL